MESFKQSLSIEKWPVGVKRFLLRCGNAIFYMEEFCEYGKFTA